MNTVPKPPNDGPETLAKKVARFMRYAFHRGHLTASGMPDGADKEAVIKKRGNEEAHRWIKAAETLLDMNGCCATSLNEDAPSREAMELENALFSLHGIAPRAGVLETFDRHFQPLRDDNARLLEDLTNCQKLVANMHAAAVGSVRGAIVGVVEDVALLRQRLERYEAEDAMVAAILGEVTESAITKKGETPETNAIWRASESKSWEQSFAAMHNHAEGLELRLIDCLRTLNELVTDSNAANKHAVSDYDTLKQAHAAEQQVAELQAQLAAEEADVRRCDNLIDGLHAQVAELEKERDELRALLWGNSKKLAYSEQGKEDAIAHKNQIHKNYASDLAASRLDSQRLDKMRHALNECDRAFASWQVGQIPGRPEDILTLIGLVRSALQQPKQAQAGVGDVLRNIRNQLPAPEYIHDGLTGRELMRIITLIDAALSPAVAEKDRQPDPYNPS